MAGAFAEQVTFELGLAARECARQKRDGTGEGPSRPSWKCEQWPRTVTGAGCDIGGSSVWRMGGGMLPKGRDPETLTDEWL